MDKNGKWSRIGLRVLTVVVKAGCLLLFLLIAVIFIGEGPPNPFELTGRELFLMVCLLAAVVGAAVAIFRQLIGGVAMVLGTLPFYPGNMNLSKGWVFHTFVLLGLLNILCWWLAKRKKG